MPLYGSAQFWHALSQRRDDGALAKAIRKSPSFESMQPGALTQFISCLGAYHHYYFQAAPTSWVRETWKAQQAQWQEAASRNIFAFSGTQLVKVLSAFEHMQMLPLPRFLSRFEKAVTFQIDRMHASGLAALPYAYGSLGRLPPHALLAGVDATMHRKIGFFKEKDLDKTLRGYALISALGRDTGLPDSTPDLIDLCAGKENAKMRKLVRSTYLSCARLAPERAVRFLSNERQVCVTSKAERRFQPYLLRAGLALEEGGRCLDRLQTEVDFAAHISGRPFLFEYDGPSHFVYDPQTQQDRLNGSTRLMTALIRQYYPDQTLVRIPSRIKDALRGEGSKRLIASLKPELAKLKTGAYQLAIQGGAFTFYPISCPPAPTFHKKVPAATRAAMP